MSLMKNEFYEHLHQIFSFPGLFHGDSEQESKIIQYILGLNEPIPDVPIPGTPLKLIDLVKVFLIPKLPIDDSKLELEKYIDVISKLSLDPKYDKFLSLLSRLLVTQLWTDITKPPSMIAGDGYRSSDGSGYSRVYSQLGVSNSRYAINSTIQTLPKDLPVFPKAETIFDKIMVCEGGFKEHPSGISSMLFYLAIIITHDLFNTSHADPNINKTSSYLDLSPLYGSNADQQATVRTFEKGLLKPDTFADQRILLQPPGVGSFLILFSRNHNYIAKNLLKNNESERFSVKDPNDPKQIKKQDEDLFQTARLVNCGFYIKIILHNYLRTILGLDKTGSSWFIDPTVPYHKSGQLQTLPTGIGNIVSLEFNFIYRWHPAVGKEDEKWIEDEFKQILGKDWERISVDGFKKKLAEWVMNIPKDPSEWSFNKMKRGSDNRFKDTDIARELIFGTKRVSGSFGANRIPKVFRPVELLGIESARASGLCSLNDFRRSLNLVPYKTFEDMNPDKEVQKKLKELYVHVENVELYPGLMSEKTKPNDTGATIALPYTISRAILSDAINLVRNDRFFTDDLNARNLTSWGWSILQSDPKDLASGGMIHKLILENTTGIYAPNSAWALYPFTIPSQTKKNLQSRQDQIWSKIDFNEPNIKA